MKDAGIEDPKDVHYVQTQTPLLAVGWVDHAKRRAGRRARCTTRWACRRPDRPRHRRCLGELPMPRAAQITGTSTLLVVASCWCGVE